MDSTPIRTTARVPSTVPSPMIRTNHLEVDKKDSRTPSPSPSACLVAIVPKDFLENKNESTVTNTIPNPMVKKKTMDVLKNTHTHRKPK